MHMHMHMHMHEHTHSVCIVCASCAQVAGWAEGGSPLLGLRLSELLRALLRQELTPSPPWLGLGLGARCCARS